MSNKVEATYHPGTDLVTSLTSENERLWKAAVNYQDANRMLRDESQSLVDASKALRAENDRLRSALAAALRGQ